MPTEITLDNRAALEPLFKPWQEPIQHRTPNPLKGGPAIVQPGRRKSRIPTVRGVRAEVSDFRKAGYAGASDTSRRLLRYWFETDHLVLDEEGNHVEFRYHWAQREAVESIVYLYEVRGLRNVASLLTEYGDDALATIALGIPPQEDRWAKYCAKVATGGGKTKIMSLVLVWSYFHRMFEADSAMPQHFVLIAPNITVYERLRDDFENGAIFHRDPLVPEDWKADFQMEVVLQEESGGTAARGALYVTNIHRLYESRDKEEDEGPVGIFGPVVKKSKALDTGETLRKRIATHPTLAVLNDEAHHLHDPGLAWNKAIDTLDKMSREKGNTGVAFQVDFTATPKHNNGELFRHIVCDFPLGEAVDAGIVKVPVLGESDDMPAVPDSTMPFLDRYHIHLQLGYQLYEKSYEEWSGVRKPILFVMTEDTDSANDVARYLSDPTQFPMLDGRVLNVHTKIKGKLKKVTRNGKEVKEFVESETGLKADELKVLRELSRDLDAKDSPYRAVVSVLMLREGWDVKNVTTIVPLRAYSAKSGILPEQTLGRGLRRMLPSGEVPEKVVVVHHPAFRSLYEQELQQEGLDIAVLPVRGVFKDTVTIFVDHGNKAVEELEIEVPLISDAIETTAELKGLKPEEVWERFAQLGWPKLPINERASDKVSYVERQMFTDEIVSAMNLDVGLLGSAVTAVSYFAQMLGRACKLTSAHAVLAPLVEEFISDHLFVKKVDLYGGEVDHRMTDADVQQYIRGVFASLILGKTVRHQDRKTISKGFRLSTWKPFQATSSEQRPALPAGRTMFNLVPCSNDFEQAFSDFCEHAKDVASFAKNAGPQKLMIDYLKPDGNVSYYVPDFLVRASSGVCYVVELKGKTDELVPLKAAAAKEWCRAASKHGDWRYLYVPYHVFQNTPSPTIEELERACLPALSGLAKEAKTLQTTLPLDEETAVAKAHSRVLEVAAQAGFSAVPPRFEQLLRQAVEALDWAIGSRQPTLGLAFQPLFSVFDKLAIEILSGYVGRHIPTDQAGRDLYFQPVGQVMASRQADTLDKNARYLRKNLVEGQSMQKLGTLLFCLTYAQDWTVDGGGIWEDVRDEFCSVEFGLLYESLKRVNNLRNTKLAHEGELVDEQEAREELAHWFGTICLMDGIVSER